MAGRRLEASLKHGVGLRSATEPFDDTPVGKLTENMLATFAQFDNDQKAETTATGMKSALGEGRWPFSPPLGSTLDIAMDNSQPYGCG